MEIPQLIQVLMAVGATIAISMSGGKDSLAQFYYVVGLYKKYGWTGQLFVVFADLGQIEWQGTIELLYRVCSEAGIDLVVVQRSKEGMIGRWQERRETLIAQSRQVPHWSSASNRFCTDHLKVQQVDKRLRQLSSVIELPKESDKPFWSSAAARFCTKELKENQCDRRLRAVHSDIVICCVGIRAQESPKRATKPRFSVRSNITTETCKPPKDCKTAEQQEAWAIEAWDIFQNLPAKIRNSKKRPRFALTWHPIFDWSIEQVWYACGTSIEELNWRRELFRCGLFHDAFAGWRGHWAYVAGNSRLSCSQCVLASRADLENGAKLNQETWRMLVQMEQESGWSFKQDLALSDLAPIVENTSSEWVNQIYQTLRNLDMIYLNQHWNLTGEELTELLSRKLLAADLKQAFKTACEQKLGQL